MTSAHKPDKKPIETYEHKDKQRLNNPPVGLVTPETDQEEGSRSYSHDSHLDPQLVWAGKAEHTSFLVPTVSLHVHERIDPRTIIAAVRRKSGQGAKQASLFEFSGENLPVREAIEFYKHRHGWSNRLVAGDSLLVMNSLLEKDGLAGQVQMKFSRVEPLPGTRWLHADAETRGEAERAVVSFGPEHAPLEQRQVERAIEESHFLVPRPKIIVFAAFQFDPEAAKDIDETNWPGLTLLKVQMNADLFTEDLKKKRASNESFWLIGQPDVRLFRVLEGKDRDKYQVEVQGFDYYDPRSGTVESGGTENIAMWMLDTDYDGRSLYPRQVFFPLSGAKDGWSRLAKNLKAEVDEELMEAYRGTFSLPFQPGPHERVAVKIIDDRGIESLRIMEVK